MKHLFTGNQKQTLTTLDQNKVNGKSAERQFASLLTSALNARVSWTSRTEDDAKLDLVTIMSHPWEGNKVEIFYTQVKSGPSYAAVKDEKLYVVKSKFSDLLHNNHSTLVCWTKVDNETSYWFFIKANANHFRKEYNTSHLLSPLSRFDLMRIVTAGNNKDGGKGLMFRQGNPMNEYPIEQVRVLRKKAKGAYASFKSEHIINPLFGEIEITRIGWRHITRESRYNRFKVASYEIIVILGSILRRTPSKHYIKSTVTKDEGDIVYRENEYILVYNQITVMDAETGQRLPVNVYIKLIEIATYRRDWRSTPNASEEIQRRVVFKSIYYKQKGRS